MRVAQRGIACQCVGTGQGYMTFGSINLRWRALLAAILGFSGLPAAQAAFNGFMPLTHSGQLAYNYGYIENPGSQSEAASLLFGWNASGYIWRPWFATTSMALSGGMSRTETTTSSSEGTVGTGSFSIGLFPQSRFPFSMTYSRSDSRTQQYQDVSQVSGDANFQSTRISLRQAYRPRNYNQLYNAWYNFTEFSGSSYGSESVTFGMNYQLRVSKQSINVSYTHSSNKTTGSGIEPTTDAVGISHVYTPSGELGVNSLITYVEVDPGTSGISRDTQAFSSFFWRPEHRAVSLTGGARLTENKTEGAVDTVTRSLNTNLGVGYRITRSLNMSAGVSVGTSDNQTAQTLSTTQTASLTYSGSRRQWNGYSHSWNWSGSAVNTATRTEGGEETISTDRQNYSTSIGQSLGKTWPVARGSSVSSSFSQSAGGSKSSEDGEANKTINHGVSLGMNSRGGRGSSYINARLSDSRSFGGEGERVFNSFGATYSGSFTFNRLSNISGNISFSASQNESENEAGVTTTDGIRNLLGGLSYLHNRPFGVYNLRFSSDLQGSRQIDSPESTATLRSESAFRYSLGKLSTSLSLRFSESAGGVLSKGLNFQATRSF